METKIKSTILFKYKSNKTCIRLINYLLQNTDKEIKEYLSKWRDIMCPWIGKFNIM